MDETVFREKSLDKVKSPDNLNEYIRVANPGIWILLVSILILLVGFCIWGIFGQVQTLITVDALCEDGIVTCRLSDSEAENISPGMKVFLNGQTGYVSEIHLQLGESSCTAAMPGAVPDGLYSAQIELESIRPVAFLTN